MLAHIAAGFMIFGFLLVIFSATSSGGFGYGPPAYSIFWLGLLVFAMEFISCIIATGKKNEEVLAA